MNLLIFLIASAGVNPLLMPASAKGVMTYYSRSNGDEAIFYNPSLFTAQKDYRVSLFYTNIYLSMKNLTLGLSRKLNDFDIGISIVNFDYGEIESRPEYPTEDSTGFYTGSDFCFGICGARHISKNGRIGAKIKYIYENIYIYSGATIGIDLSLAYVNEHYGLSVGASNIGGTIKLANESVNLPAKLSFGYYRTIKNIDLSLDVHYLVNTSSFESSFATEIKLGKNFETGFSINFRGQAYPGFYLGVNHQRLSIKYGTSFYPYDLGMINTIGVGLQF